MNKEFLLYLWNSLNGFYQPDYDDLPPEEVYRLYIKRKQFLIDTKKPNKFANQKKLRMDWELMQFAKNYPHTLVGFFKDKQSKRNLDTIL